MVRFRSPHYTISHAGLVGGGNIPKPGEISLPASRCFIPDEFPRIQNESPEVMRQLMEDKAVTISRAKGPLYFFFSKFQLIAAMNPRPCGFYRDSQKPVLAPAVVTKYQNGISGPLSTALTFTSKCRVGLRKT
ncbi:MAG: ATP-binding protein [Anaerolineales bacterium]|nr:ATP-binding protein [Anaerolineales bacterium]